MDQVFSYIFKVLLDEDINQIKVKMNETENDIVFYVSASHNLRHRVIGKDGKVINAIRDYLKTISKKFGNKKVFVKINEV